MQTMFSQNLSSSCGQGTLAGLAAPYQNIYESGAYFASTNSFLPPRQAVSTPFTYPTSLIALREEIKAWHGDVKL